jgi:hypothetical protein
MGFICILLIFVVTANRSNLTPPRQKREEPLERGLCPLSYSFPLPFKNYEGKGARGIGLPD